MDIRKIFKRCTEENTSSSSSSSSSSKKRNRIEDMPSSYDIEIGEDLGSETDFDSVSPAKE